MNICDKSEDTIPEWVNGHLYKWKESEDIYLAVSEKRLVNIKTGDLFETTLSNLGRDTQDVTDQYCLQKIK